MRHPIVEQPRGRRDDATLGLVAEVCGRKKPIGQVVDRNPVPLLRPGLGEIVRAQACFDMGDRQAKTAGGEGASRRRIGISLDDHEIWLDRRQD